MTVSQVPSGFSAEALSEQVSQYGFDPLLTPAQVAAMLNVSPKWLADAREGRKQLSGPPYIKLGRGKTSPIRYPLAGLQEWRASFQTQTYTCQRVSEFLDTGEGRWLYLVNDETLQAIEFFAAVWQHIVPNSKWRPRWMTAADVKAGRFFSAQNRLLSAAALQLDSAP